MSPEAEPILIKAEASSNEAFILSKTKRLIYFFMMVFGLSSLLPWNMVITATGFFSAKFSETESKRISESFPQYFQIGGIGSNVAFSLGSMILLKYVRIKPVVFATNFVIMVVFAVITVFAHMDTKSWAYTYFVTVNFLFCLSCALSASYISGVTATASMLFPSAVSGFYLGQGMAGLFATAISVVTLSLPAIDPIKAGFYYFLIATLTLLTAFVCYCIFNRLSYVRHAYIAAENRKSLGSADVPSFEIFKQVWQFCLTSLLTLLITLACFPAAFSALESTSYNTSMTWRETYFKPIIVFLMFNIGDVIGRITASVAPFPTPKWILPLSILRVVFIPLVFLCNLQPRIIPVWFRHDSLPGIFNFLLSLSNGHFLSLAASYAPQHVATKAEQAVVGTFSGNFQFVFP